MRAGHIPGGWKRRLNRDIGWLLLAKLIGLTLLWALFFSPSRRERVDGSSTASHLAITPMATAPNAPDDTQE